VYVNSLNKNKFELMYIASLSIIGGLVLGFLFKLSIIAYLITMAILAITFSSFLMLLSIMLEQEEKPVEPKKKIVKGNKFVALGKQSPTIHTQIRMPKKEKISKADIQSLVVETKTELEIFKESPIEELNKTKDSIIELMQKTQEAIKKIDHIFANRMHKNTKNDIQNFLYLKTLNDALTKRLELVIDTLDEIENKDKVSLKNSFNLAYGPLIIQRDSFNTVNIEDKATELPKNKWQPSVEKTITSLMRKKTFNSAMQFALFVK